MNLDGALPLFLSAFCFFWGFARPLSGGEKQKRRNIVERSFRRFWGQGRPRFAPGSGYSPVFQALLRVSRPIRVRSEVTLSKRVPSSQAKEQSSGTVKAGAVAVPPWDTCCVLEK